MGHELSTELQQRLDENRWDSADYTLETFRGGEQMLVPTRALLEKTRLELEGQPEADARVVVEPK